MEYCELHKDLADEEGEECPLCECMRDKARVLTKYGDQLRRQAELLRRAEEVVREGIELSRPHSNIDNYQRTDWVDKADALLPELRKALEVK